MKTHTIIDMDMKTSNSNSSAALRDSMRDSLLDLKALLSLTTRWRLPPHPRYLCIYFYFFYLWGLDHYSALN